MVDIAGFLEDVDAKSASQLQSVTALSSQAHDVLAANERVRVALGDLMDSSTATLETVHASVDLVRNGAERSKNIAGWVQKISGQMTAMAKALDTVLRSNEEIASIASQVNILAINAKIEAARAGDAGRGFAVVADAINELSGKTARAAGDISDNVTTLFDQVETLNRETDQVSVTAAAVLKDSRNANEAMIQIANATEQSSQQTEQSRSEADTVRTAAENFLPTFDQIDNSVGETAHGVHHANEKAASLVDLTEAIVQDTVGLGGVSPDHTCSGRCFGHFDRV